MPQRNMFPWYGYRVEDNSSIAFYEKGQGIYAALSDEWVPLYPEDSEDMSILEEMLHDHLNWYSRTPTPFISVSSNKDWVLNEARRRQVAGKTNVVVYQISLMGMGRQHQVKYPHFKSVQTLLDRAESDIPSHADYPCTRYEYLFLHHIPDEFITEVSASQYAV